MVGILEELTGTLKKKNHVPRVSFGTILGGGLPVKFLLIGYKTTMLILRREGVDFKIEIYYLVLCSRKGG